MKKIILTNLIIMAFIVCGNVSAGEKDHASKDWQIKAYSTAAPSFIGKYATIIGGRGKIIRKGSNGWTCQNCVFYVVLHMLLQHVGTSRF